VANLISARSSKVFLLPEWSAWMAEEHFYLTRYPPEKKKACACFPATAFVTNTCALPVKHDI